MGAVLSQINEQGEEHPVGYYSRKLLPTEKKWDIWELELAAVVWATTACRNYLRSVQFELITDSKVVAALIKKEVPTRRENLVVRLFEYNFTVTHRKGELNRNADFFSRWATYKDWEDQSTVQMCYLDNRNIPTAQRRLADPAFHTTLKTHCLSVDCFVTGVSSDDHFRAEEMKEVRRRIAEEQRKDPRVMKIITKLLETQSEQAEEHKDPVPTHRDSDSVGATTDQHDQPVSRNESSELGRPKLALHTLHTLQQSNTKQHTRFQDSTEERKEARQQRNEPVQRQHDIQQTRAQATLTSKSSTAKANASRPQPTKRRHRARNTAGAVNEATRSRREEPDNHIQEDIPGKQLPKQPTFKLVGDEQLLVKAVTFRTAKSIEPQTFWPIVVPSTLVHAVMSLFHGDTSVYGHGGMHKTYGVLKTRFVWKGVGSAIRRWIATCHKCLRRKRVVPQLQTYNIHPPVTAPMNKIAIHCRATSRNEGWEQVHTDGV